MEREVKKQKVTYKEIDEIVKDAPSLIRWLDAGGDPNLISDEKFGLKLLHLVITSEDVELVALLLARGADPNASTSAWGETFPLIILHRTVNPTILRLLNAFGTRFNDLYTGDGSNVLHYCAVDEKATTNMQLMIDFGADVNHKKSGGRTPLYLACETGNEGAVRILLKNGASPDIQAYGNYSTIPNGHFPIDIAKKNGFTAIVELLENHSK